MRKLRKSILMILLLIFSVFAMGCTNTIKLSPQEENAIAKRMSELILDNDKSYQKSLLKTNEEKLEIDIDKNLEKEEEKQEKQEKENEINPEQLLLNQKAWNYNSSILVEFVKQDLVRDLPEEESDCFYLGPDKRINEDGRILQFTLKVTNNSNRNKNFNIIDSNFFFYLKIGDSVHYPMITFLPNDIQFADVSLSPSESKTFVLLYSVPADINMDAVGVVVVNNRHKNIKEKT